MRRWIPILPLALAACAAEPPPAAPAQPMLPAPPVAATAPPAPALPGPPVAPTREVRDTYFGQVVVDPYRWMEADSPDLAAWMKGQADYARGALDARPELAALRARLKDLDNAAPRMQTPVRRGRALFYVEAAPSSDSYKLYTREGLDGPARVLVDPDALGKDGKHVSIDYFTASPDGRLVAYGLSESGSEMSTLHVLEVKSGKVLPDTIDRARYAHVSFLDEASFFYRRNRKLAPDAPANERFVKSRVYLHRMGTDPDADPPVFGSGVAPGIPVPDDGFPVVAATPGSPWVLAVIDHGVQPDVTLYAAKRSEIAGDKTPWRKIAEPADEIVDYRVKGDDLYFLSHHGAPRFQLQRVGLKKPELGHAVTLIPPGEAVLSWAVAGADAIYVRTLDAGVGRLRRVPFTTGKPEDVAIPGGASVEDVVASPTLPGALIKVASWTTAPQILVVDARTGKVEDTRLLPPSPVAFTDIVADEVKAKSEDGTLVPLSILRRRDLPLDGRSPTWLRGYASYGSSEEPEFEPKRLAWLERGGVVAVCHARGGGEYGEEWHQAGKLATKPNTVADFVACARKLVDDKITSPAHLAGEGFSAGGILIGGAITAHPEIFGAAIIHGGMVNALRFEEIPIGPFNTSEFGSVKTEAGFKMLTAIDAYHHVTSGVAYPAVLLTTGIKDPRVSPWQSAKMAARLQASSASGKPVLLRVAYDDGHGNGSSRSQQQEELADVFAFLLWQIGK